MTGKKIKKYKILDSDYSDDEQTNNYEDDDEEYHTISDINNSNSGKDHLANKDCGIIHNAL